RVRRRVAHGAHLNERLAGAARAVAVRDAALARVGAAHARTGFARSGGAIGVATADRARVAAAPRVVDARAARAGTGRRGSAAAPPAQGAPGVVPPEQRVESMSPSRKSRSLRGMFTLCASPLEQSAVPVAFAVIVRMPHVLAAALPCAPFGIGSGGPNRQPVVVQVWNLQLPKLQFPGEPQHFLPLFKPPEHVPP